MTKPDDLQRRILTAEMPRLSPMSRHMAAAVAHIVMSQLGQDEHARLFYERYIATML